MGSKVCIKCGIEKSEDCYYWAKGSKKITVKNKRMNTCKECFCKLSAERAVSLREKKREQHALLLKENPDRKKKCRTCGLEKVVAEFVFHSTMADLLNGECRKCGTKRTKKRVNTNKDKLATVDFTSRKTCRVCGKEKELLDFNKHFGNKDLHRQECKVCQKEASGKRYAEHGDEYRKKRREWTKDNPDKVHHSHLKNKFGISREDYLAMVKEQDGKCAICGTTKTGKAKHFAVDHDHETGAIRSLLCSSCNTGIGHLKDDPSLLIAAAKYLERHKP